MSSARNLRRVVWLACGLGLLGLVGIVLWLHGPERPTKTKESREGESLAKKEPEIRFLNEKPIRLVPGEALTAELRGGEGYRYTFALEAGQIARIVVEQKGVDVELRYRRPGRDKPVVVDSPNWRLGQEIVYELAESAHTYGLDVACRDFEAPPGRYEILLDDPHPASPEDRVRFDAWRAFRNGESRRLDKRRQEALEKYENSLALWRQIGESSWEATALHRIGWMRQLLGDNQAALDPLHQALAAFRKEGRRLEEGLALNVLGQAQFQLSDWQSSLETHAASLPLFQELGMVWMAASALNGRGNALSALGRTQQALESYRQALDKARAAGPMGEQEQALALYGIGDLLIYQDRREQAREFLSEAVQAAGLAGDDGTRASALTRLAMIDQRENHFSEAREKLEQALAIHRQDGSRWGEAAALSSLGTVHLLAGETEEAGASYRQALDLYRSLHDSDGEGFALSNLGRYFYEKRDFRQSLAFHEQAAKLFHRLARRRGEVSTLFGSARALRELGELDAARERLEKVLDSVEVLRAESDQEDLRASYLATRQHYFDLYVDVLMQLGLKDKAGSSRWSEAAFEVHEKRRARSLLDVLAETGGEARVDSPLLAQENEIQDQINALKEKTLEMEQGGAESRQLAGLDAQQQDLLDRLDELRREIRKQNPKAALLRPDPLRFDEIRSKVLRKGTALLVFSLGEQRSFLWYIPFEGKESVHVLPPRALLENAAREIHDGWSHAPGGSMAAAGHWAIRLSRELLGSVAERLTTRRLVIVSDGALEYLPFGALPDPRALPPEGKAGDYDELPKLLESHEIVYLPSVSTLGVLREEEKNRKFPVMGVAKRIGVIADPVFGPGDERVRKPQVASPLDNPEEMEGPLRRAASDLGVRDFPRLPFTANEAEVIRELVPSGLRFEALDFAANPETVKGKDVRACRVLHFATHGLLDTRHPELSGLLLSRVDEEGVPRKDKGFLLGHQIRNLNLTAELVVLSACETGLGKEVRGEGLVGLTRSFMYAGVPRLVVSLWKVGDQGTSELMRRFYRILLTRDYSPSEALRCAQLSMIKNPRWRSPYDWAAFVFQGEWSWSRRTSGDGGIETPVGAVRPGDRPDDDLPPPILGGPAGCPDDIEF